MIADVPAEHWERTIARGLPQATRQSKRHKAVPFRAMATTMRDRFCAIAFYSSTSLVRSRGAHFVLENAYL